MKNRSRLSWDEIFRLQERDTSTDDTAEWVQKQNIA